eukprot:5882410-Pleurochrysis_carterae.AAC.1
MDLSTHQVERDRPSERRPPTARVIATINSQERIVRRTLQPVRRPRSRTLGALIGLLESKPSSSRSFRTVGA